MTRVKLSRLRGATNICGIRRYSDAIPSSRSERTRCHQNLSQIVCPNNVNNFALFLNFFLSLSYRTHLFGVIHDVLILVLFLNLEHMGSISISTHHNVRVAKHARRFEVFLLIDSENDPSLFCASHPVTLPIELFIRHVTCRARKVLRPRYYRLSEPPRSKRGQFTDTVCKSDSLSRRLFFSKLSSHRE